MPDTRILRHTPALMGEANFSSFAGLNVVRFVETASADTLLQMPSEALSFWDMPAFLHGYGSRSNQTLQTHIQTGWSTGGAPHTLTIVIDPDTDRIRISISSEQIRIKAGPDNHLLGFDNDSDTAFAAVLTAPNPWRRGVFQMTQGLDIQIQSSGTPGSIYRTPLVDDLHRVQSLPTYMRDRGSLTDADNVWAGTEDPNTSLGICLERLLQSHATPKQGFRAMVEKDGRVTFNFTSDSLAHASASSCFTTSSERRFWARLGGDCTETAVAVGNRFNLTTKNPSPCVLAVDRGYVQLRRNVSLRDDFAEMSDGSMVTAGLAPIRGWDMTLRVVGPAHGFDFSLEQHLRDWWQHSRRALTFYPQWGDPDYALGGCDLRRDVRPATLVEEEGGPEKYSIFRTPEAHISLSNLTKRKGGRLMVRVTRGGQKLERYRESLDCYQDIQLKLQDDPTR